MSTLKVTTIQTAAGGTVTLTKQDAAKSWSLKIFLFNGQMPVQRKDSMMLLATIAWGRVAPTISGTS